MVQFKFIVFVLVAAAAAPVFALPILGSNESVLVTFLDCWSILTHHI